MTAGNVYITLDIDTRQFRRVTATFLRAIEKLQYSWRRFFRSEYWRTWKITLRVLLEDAQERMHRKGSATMKTIRSLIEYLRYNWGDVIMVTGFVLMFAYVLIGTFGLLAMAVFQYCTG